MGMSVSLQEFKQRACLRTSWDPLYVAPGYDDLVDLMSLMEWREKDVAHYTGVRWVRDGGSITVRKWRGTGGKGSTIPYSSWRLLLIYAGLATPGKDVCHWKANRPKRKRRTPKKAKTATE